MKISATIITFNEEENISRALNSLDWADEIVVVDSKSSDNTVNIAKEFGARVFIREWPGFGKQKQFAVNKCQNDWVFSLDADEVVSSDLKKTVLEIKSNIDSNPFDGYRFSRLSFYMNKPIHHSGWYPDWQLRLFNREKGRWKDLKIHESVEMAAGSKIAKIKKDIFHYSVKNAAHHNRMITERYAPLAARQMFENGQRTSPFKIATSGFISFFSSFILKAGFLDGFPGFCISKFSAHHSFLKNLLLWELQNKTDKH